MIDLRAFGDPLVKIKLYPFGETGNILSMRVNDEDVNHIRTGFIVSIKVRMIESYYGERPQLLYVEDTSLIMTEIKSFRALIFLGI